MTSCSWSKFLSALLSDDLDVNIAETLVDHLGQCDACGEALGELSVELDDWHAWESMLRTQRLSWPCHDQLETRLDGRWATTETASPGSDMAEQGPESPTPEAAQLAETYVYSGVAPSVPSFAGAHPDQRARRRFGDYELLDKLGEGGMGIVYLARQKSADRLVALKLIRPEQLEALPDARRQAWLDRFRTEAQTAARLEHDHVVTIYDVGEFNGTLYYSMQYIEGQSLAQIARDGPMENRRVAQLMQSVAMAVDHAHRQGILHRDLKPQNILIRQVQRDAIAGSSAAAAGSSASASTPAANERPYVADFGLAKCLEEGTDGTTHTGEVVGSPSYMSPEQAQDASRCTPASDIYSLGATLYDLLTGRPPFQAFSAIETLRQVIDQDPIAPRDLNPAIDLDLQTITLKALAKEPSRRYVTAAEMADDLQRYVRREPIQARPISTLERSLRWCRRNPAIALLAAGVATLLLVGVFGSIAYSVRLGQHAKRENMLRTEAESYFVMTLNVIDEMLAEFGDEALADVPQMEQARKNLLGKALRLHEELLQQKPSNRELQVAFARVQHRIGDLYDLLGEHYKAKSAYEEAIRLFERIQRAHPEDHELRQYLAKGHTMLGETLRKTSPAEARRHYEEALAIQRELQRLAPGNSEYSRELSRTLNNLGLVLTETGQHGAAESALLNAITHLQELASTADARADVLADLGRSQINLGVLLRKQADRAAQAEAPYRDAIRNLEQAVGLDPDNRDYRHRLAVATVDLGNYFLSEVTDGADQALPLTANANAKFRGLRDDFPGIPSYRYELANSHSSMAIALAMLSKPDAATTQFQHASRVLDQLAQDFPEYADTVPEYQSLKGRVLGGLGYLHSLTDDLDSARAFVEQAIECQQQAAQLGPENPEYIEFLGQHYAFLSGIFSKLNLPEQAKELEQAANSFSLQAAAMKARHIPSDDSP